METKLGGKILIQTRNVAGKFIGTLDFRQCELSETCIRLPIHARQSKITLFRKARVLYMSDIV
jgi:hypothetical protein